MFDFSRVVDHHGMWRTQWNYVADRFGAADLLLLTISDMGFATASCIIEALNQCLIHGVFGCSRWKNDEFLAAITHWFSTQHCTTIDSQLAVYGLSVIYMVSEPVCQRSETGKGMVVYTPAYDAFYKVIEGNQHTVMPVVLERQPGGWFCGMDKLEVVLAKPECKTMLLCSSQNLIGKVWTYDGLEIVVDLCERYGVWAISDEIYTDMVWGEQLHIPWSNVARGDWALLTSGSKSLNILTLTGAYGITGNSNSRDTYLSALKGRDGLSSLSVLVLTVHVAAYQQDIPWLDALRAYLKDSLIYIVDKMNATFPELNWQTPQSTYLAWLDLRPLDIGDNALQKTLIEQERIVITPGCTYGEEGCGFVRLNADCPRPKLGKGVTELINTVRAVG